MLSGVVWGTKNKLVKKQRHIFYKSIPSRSTSVPGSTDCFLILSSPLTLDSLFYSTGSFLLAIIWYFADLLWVCYLSWKCDLIFLSFVPYLVAGTRRHIINICQLDEFSRIQKYRMLKKPTGPEVSVVGTGNGRFERTPKEGAAGLAGV